MEGVGGSSPSVSTMFADSEESRGFGPLVLLFCAWMAPRTDLLACVKRTKIFNERTFAIYETLLRLGKGGVAKRSKVWYSMSGIRCTCRRLCARHPGMRAAPVWMRLCTCFSQIFAAEHLDYGLRAANHIFSPLIPRLPRYRGLRRAYRLRYGNSPRWLHLQGMHRLRRAYRLRYCPQ